MKQEEKLQQFNPPASHFYRQLHLFDLALPIFKGESFIPLRWLFKNLIPHLNKGKSYYFYPRSFLDTHIYSEWTSFGKIMDKKILQYDWLTSFLIKTQ